MIPVLDTDAWVEKLLSTRRSAEGKILAFYEHRMGAICRDPRLLLMPADDHLAHRGDGVFESMKYEGRRLYQLDAHLERIERSARGIHLTSPCTREVMRNIVLEVARAADVDNGCIRILLGRGPGGFGIDPAECPVPSLYVVAYSLSPKPDAWYDKGVTAFRTSIPAKQGYLATIKNANYIPNVLMKLEARERGCDIPVSFDADDHIAEGPTENLCLVDSAGTLVVPEFTNALSGTTIMRVIDMIKGEMPVAFRQVREDELYTAAEVMVLGTTTECVSVVAFEGQPLGGGKPGPVARKFRNLLRKDLVENGVRF
ncbi:aminotransferase class IV [Oleidesulfovibrio sp.]|uniref:aminotransferase class IV n=1 Tax=Oleidesulfovibrio sp. TaxID=2909707 RepID=UPI003A8786AC